LTDETRQCKDDRQVRLRRVVNGMNHSLKRISAAL